MIICNEKSLAQSQDMKEQILTTGPVKCKRDSSEQGRLLIGVWTQMQPPSLRFIYPI